MKAMNKKVLAEVLARPHICVRHKEGNCRGNPTIEHVVGRKNEASWNCIWLCEYHHSVNQYQGGDGLNKEINKLHAYQNISTDELKNYKLASQMIQEKKYLEERYPHLLS